MAGIRWIIFAFCVVSSGAQFGFNPNGPKSFRPLQLTSPRKSPVSFKAPFLQALQKTLQDHKCTTYARRPFFMVRTIRYPCSRGMNGLPVARSFMGRMGPICQSYMRVPIVKFYKVTSCCAGWSADPNGKCTIRNRNKIQIGNNNRLPVPMPSPRPRNPLPPMSVAASMRMAMLQRAKQVMAKKRAMMAAAHIARMARMRQMYRMIRPPMSPLPYIFNKLRMKMLNKRPKVAFLRFGPPLPRPVSRQPMKTRTIKIVPTRTPSRMFTPNNRNRIPFVPRPFPLIPRPPRVFRPFPMIPRPVPTMVLSNRRPMLGFRPMLKMHFNEPNVPQIPRAPKVEPTSPTQIPADFPKQKPFPQIPVPAKEPVGSPKTFPIIPPTQFRPPAPKMQEGILPVEEQQMMQVDLPRDPVQMPDLIVEEGPMNQGTQGQSCIVILESAVKRCLKKNKIDVPDVMTAFEPFNDDMSRVLCEKEDVIFNCINDALKGCSESPDETTARGMLDETTATVRDMCAMREMSVEVTDAVAAVSALEGEKPLLGSQSKSATDTKAQDTGAVIDTVEAVPKSSPAPINKEILTGAEAKEMMKQAIKHEVHVQEVEMREYYLPILIGSGAGFVILVLILSLVLCCCCKRKLKRKMKMVKEPEKPPLEGIYTIGVPPPVYEVKGIPEVYYEEAKGEKITSGSPSVLEGTDIEHIPDRNEYTSM